MEFIDTHTHCTDEAFAGCEEDVIARAVKAGVTKMILADIDSSEREPMLGLCRKHKGVLFPMLGLYPGSVDSGWRDEIDLMVSSYSDDIVAVGEIGLDYHYGAEHANEQMEAFRTQLELAAKWNLPVNIHLREATEDFFTVLSGCRSLGLRGDIHAFSGSYETFLRCQKYGHWKIGVGGVVTFKNAALAESVRKIPLEMIVLETDAPYLAPTPLRGTRNESANIPLIAAKIAELKGTDIEKVAEVTSANAKELFSI